jgi:hypothetical protein
VRSRFSPLTPKRPLNVFPASWSTYRCRGPRPRDRLFCRGQLKKELSARLRDGLKMVLKMDERVVVVVSTKAASDIIGESRQRRTKKPRH